MASAWHSLENKFFAFMEKAEEKTGIPATKFFVEPLETHGIPSLAVFLIIIALLVGGIFFAFFPTGIANQVLIQVTSGNTPIEGAQVDILENNRAIASQTTDREGNARFSGLPDAMFSIRVSKQGYASFDTVTAGRLASVIGIELQSIASAQFELTVIDEVEQTPVEDASVSYEFGSESGTAQTNGKGIASFALSGKGILYLTISAQGFKTKTASLTLSKLKATIQLERFSSDEFQEAKDNAIEQLQMENTGEVVVSVLDESGTSVSAGTVLLYDAETGDQIAEAEISSGTAIFKNQLLGQSVFISVFATGFLGYAGAANTKQVTGHTTFLVVLKRATADNSGKIIVQTVDETGSPASATVLLLMKPAVILAEEFSDGRIEFDAAKNAEFYVAAYAEGKVPKQSSALKAGDTTTLTLASPTAETSASLNVNVQDDEELPVYTDVYLTTSEGLFVLPEQSTDENGKTVFTGLEKNKEYKVRATYLGKTSQSEVFLSADWTETLTIELYSAFLRLSAIDFATGAEITPSFTISQEGAADKQCALQSDCKVKAFKEIQLQASLEGYFDYSASLPALQPDETQSFVAQLVPASAAQGASIQIFQLTDKSGEVVEKVSPGNDYLARFLFIPAAQADAVGMNLRIGTRANVVEENAGILEYPYADYTSASINFQPQSECLDLDPAFINPVDGLFKWVDLKYADASSHELVMKIRVKNEATVGETISLNYRSYSNKGGVYSRDPVDEELGTAASSAVKAGCYAKTKFTNYDIVAGPATVTPTPRATPSPRVTPSAKPSATPTAKPTVKPDEPSSPTSECSNYACSKCTESECMQLYYEGKWCNPQYDEEYIFYQCATGPGPNQPQSTPTPTPPPYNPDFGEGASITLDGNEIVSSVDEIVLQIDSVYPADAFPLSLQGSTSCSLLYELKSTGGTQSCYAYYADAKALVVKADSLNANCPLKVNGNNIQGDSTASLRIYSPCSAIAQKEIPIRVSTANAESVLGRPGYLSAGDSSAKLIYAVNEKQGTRNLQIGSQEIGFNTAGALAIAWSGPGSLSLSERGTNVMTWNYEKSLSWFGGKGELGSQIKSCSDYACCTEGWCTSTAAGQMIAAFKVKAKKTFDETAGRRGNAEPMTTIGTHEFVFSTAAQFGEGASPTGFQVEGKPGACKEGNPGVYELTASTSDGVSWTFKARVLQLKYNLGDSANKPYLCNFLYGNGKKIEWTEKLNLASNEQAKKNKPKFTLSYMTDLTGTMFTPLLPASPTTAVKCKSASSAFKAAHIASTTAITALKAAAVACSTLLVNPCGLCLEKVGELQTAFVAYSNAVGPTPLVATAIAPVQTAAVAAQGACGPTPAGPAVPAVISALSAEATAGSSCDSMKTVLADLTIPTNFDGGSILTSLLTAKGTNAQCLPVSGEYLLETEAPRLAQNALAKLLTPTEAQTQEALDQAVAAVEKLEIPTLTVGCVARCRPMPGRVDVIPYSNTVQVVVRLGVTCMCKPAMPQTRDLLLKIAPAMFYSQMGEMGQQMYSLYGTYASFSGNKMGDSIFSILEKSKMTPLEKNMAIICEDPVDLVLVSKATTASEQVASGIQSADRTLGCTTPDCI